MTRKRHEDLSLTSGSHESNTLKFRNVCHHHHHGHHLLSWDLEGREEVLLIQVIYFLRTELTVKYHKILEVQKKNLINIYDVFLIRRSISALWKSLISWLSKDTLMRGAFFIPDCRNELWQFGPACQTVATYLPVWCSDVPPAVSCTQSLHWSLHYSAHDMSSPNPQNSNSHFTLCPLESLCLFKRYVLEFINIFT